MSGSHYLIRTALTLLVFAVASSAFALKPSHEADRLMLAAEEAFAAGNRRQAEDFLNDALQLGIALPPEFNYLYGNLLAQQGKPIDARRYLEQYINREGENGRFYRDALKLITDIQKQPRNTSRAVTNANPGKSEIRRADGGEVPYVEHIQQLYGTSDTAAALILHLNNLLKFYAYGDERIVASTRAGTPSRHKIQHSNRGEIISFNKIGSSAETPFTEDRFSVFGVNPHVSYQCRASTSSCWLYHPVTSQRWLQIVRNEDIALEISKALSQLIRNLQKTTWLFYLLAYKN